MQSRLDMLYRQLLFYIWLCWSFRVLIGQRPGGGRRQRWSWYQLEYSAPCIWAQIVLTAFWAGSVDICSTPSLFTPSFICQRPLSVWWSHRPEIALIRTGREKRKRETCGTAGRPSTEVYRGLDLSLLWLYVYACQYYYPLWMIRIESSNEIGKTTLSDAVTDHTQSYPTVHASALS